MGCFYSESLPEPPNSLQVGLCQLLLQVRAGSPGPGVWEIHSGLHFGS